MVRLVFLLLISVAALVNGWTDTFERQSSLTGGVCKKHYHRSFTEDGVNYRLDKEGALIYRNESRASNFNSPRMSFYRCVETCRDNPRCTAFAYSESHRLCQTMAHCMLEGDESPFFSYFSRKTFACSGVTVPQHGRMCVDNGGPSYHFGGYTRVDQCMEAAITSGAQYFTMNGNMECSLWESCSNTTFMANATIYTIE